MFCCTLLYVHSSIAIILMGKRELVALLNLSSWCLVMVERLFLAVPWCCLRFVIVVFPDHTRLHVLLFLSWRAYWQPLSFLNVQFVNTMHNKFSNFLCFASLCAHLCAISNNFNCNDENRILGN